MSPDGALAWASRAFLRKHGILVGRIVQVSTYLSQRKSTAIARIFRKSSNHNDNGDDVDVDVLELSSVAYINLQVGLGADSTTLQNRTTKNTLFNGSLLVIQTSDIPTAKKVTLRRWGCPPPPPPQTTEAGKQDESTLEGIQQLSKSNTWPAEQSILHVGGWVTATASSNVIFYETVEVRDLDDKIVSSAVFLSQKDTAFRIEQGPFNFTSCPLFPDMFSMRRTLLPSNALRRAPHPNSLELERAWNLPLGRLVPPAECIWHVIGNPDEHEFLEAVVSAARNRQILSVKGLSLYAYRSGRKLVASGGLADKLTGLRQALQDSRKAGPCILVLPDLDQELCPANIMGQDARLRHDQESRLLSVLFEELNLETNRVNTLLPTIPAVLVIFSTRCLLPPGPLRQHLVWESIRLSLPNRPYQSYIWERALGTTPRGALLELLDGRSANEISSLAKEIQLHLDESSSNEDELSLLQVACAKRDKQQRMSKANAHVPSVHWDDIGGLAHVRSEIMDAIELPLANPHLFPAGSGRSGILLFGPPGTGKTLIAKAVATECKLPFLSVKGPELLGSYVGESEANVRNIFQEARERGSRNKPPACILFFDEMESLAPKRGEQGSGGGNVMDRVVATLFAEMDRNTEACQIFCIGATNRPDLLDNAMLRPGRFDRLVYLGIQKSDYANILAAQLRNVKVEGDLDLIVTSVADMLPPTMTGADISGIVSSALLRATHRLCDQADAELKAAREKGVDMSLDELLRNWTDEKVEPVMVLYDLILAANDSKPSLTEAELKRYENLKKQMNVA